MIHLIICRIQSLRRKVLTKLIHTLDNFIIVDGPGKIDYGDCVDYLTWKNLIISGNFERINFANIVVRHYANYVYQSNCECKKCDLGLGRLYSLYPKCFENEGELVGIIQNLSISQIMRIDVKRNKFDIISYT
jgi:hypothetical protein